MNSIQDNAEIEYLRGVVADLKSQFEERGKEISRLQADIKSLSTCLNEKEFRIASLENMKKSDEHALEVLEETSTKLYETNQKLKEENDRLVRVCCVLRSQRKLLFEERDSYKDYWNNIRKDNDKLHEEINSLKSVLNSKHGKCRIPNESLNHVYGKIGINPNDKQKMTNLENQIRHYQELINGMVELAEKYGVKKSGESPING